MRSYGFFMIVTLMLLAGCKGRKTVFEEFTSFERNNWQKFNLLSYDFEIDAPGGDYDIFLLVRYNENFPEKFLVFNAELITSHGEQRLREYNLQLVGFEGNMLGAKSDGFYEAKKLLFKDLSFRETGKQLLEIQSMMKDYEVGGIEQIGLRVVN